MKVEQVKDEDTRQRATHCVFDLRLATAKTETKAGAALTPTHPSPLYLSLRACCPKSSNCQQVGSRASLTFHFAKQKKKKRKRKKRTLCSGGDGIGVAHHAFTTAVG